MGERPVYRKTAVISAGSYTWIGDADARMTPMQLYEIETFKDGRRDDVSVDPQADFDMLNPEKRRDFISRAQRERSLLARRNEDEILELSGACRRGSPTLAGLMTMASIRRKCTRTSVLLLWLCRGPRLKLVLREGGFLTISALRGPSIACLRMLRPSCDVTAER